MIQIHSRHKIKFQILIFTFLFKLDTKHISNTNTGLTAIGGEENEIDLDTDLKRTESNNKNTAAGGTDTGVFIMNTKNEDHNTASFFAQPGILAGKSFAHQHRALRILHFNHVWQQATHITQTYLIKLV